LETGPCAAAPQTGERRVKGEEIVCPICVGTVAWWQGKKVRSAARIYSAVCAATA